MVSTRVPKRKLLKFEQIAREFTENSSLHGIKYIGDEKTTLVEKIAWMILFVAGASFAIYMCYNYWAKWDASPMITVFDSTTLSLKDVPFPALTICNNNKISRRKLESLMRNPRYAAVSYEDIRLALRIMNKVDLALPEKFGNDIPRIAATLEAAQISMDELMFLMKETLTPCEEIIIDCTWQDKAVPCSKLFVGRATNDGFCCSFNAFNVQGFLNYVKLDEWKNYLKKYENALARNTSLPNPPEPTNFQNLTIRYINGTMQNTNSAGIFAGLTVILDAKIDDYNGTTSNTNGFRFLLHDADDFPDVGDRGFLSGADSEIHVGFEGIIISADPVVRDVDLKKRECYMDEEFKLRYFGRYTASNCLMECLTERMISKYGCRPYFYPVPFTLPICTLANLVPVAQLLAEARADQDVYCPHCMPTCNSVRFRTSFSYASFPGQSFSSSLVRKRLINNNIEYEKMEKNGTFTNYVRENMIPINLFYQEKTGMRYKMQMRYGWEDFVSALGGLRLQYTVEEGTTTVEKLVWFFVILSAASFSVYMCYMYWQKSVQLPLLISFNSTNANLDVIPFPALTICSINKFSDEKLNKTIASFPKYSNISTEIWRKVLRTMTSPELLNTTMGNNTSKILDALQNSNISLYDVLYVMKKTKVECEDIIVRCEWLGKTENCSALFTGRLTDDGYACTFNANETKNFLPQVNETAQEEYLNGTLNTNPNENGGMNLKEIETNRLDKYYDSKTAGLFGGLTVILDGRTHDYSVTTSDFDGFRLLLHDATEFPDVGERGFIIGLDSQVHIGIQCTVVNADSAVLRVNSKARNCYIENERKLEEFKSYSASNCKLECMTNITMKNASCRPYFYPVRHVHRICNVDQLQNLSQILQQRRTRNLCPDCLPTCDNKIYGYRLSRAPFPGSKFFQSELSKELHSHTNYKGMNDSAFKEYVTKNVVSVSLYYEEPICMTYKMEVRYGWDDFVASMGGILGLGVGFSAITVFECLYFFCVRRFLPKSLPKPLNPHFPDSSVIPASTSSPNSVFRPRRYKSYRIVPTSYSSHTKTPTPGYVLQPITLPILTSIPVIPSWLADPDRN